MNKKIYDGILINRPIINDSIDSLGNLLPNIDSKYGPFESIQEALESIPIYLRSIGLTVGVYKIKNTPEKELKEIDEYWWKEGIEDNLLVLKNSTSALIEIPEISEITEDDVGNIFLYVGETKIDDLKKKWVQGWFYIIVKKENSFDIEPINVQNTEASNYDYENPSVTYSKDITEVGKEEKNVKYTLDFILDTIFYKDTKAKLLVFDNQNNLLSKLWETGTIIPDDRVVKWKYIQGENRLEENSLNIKKLGVALSIATDKRSALDLGDLTQTTNYTLYYSYLNKDKLSTSDNTTTSISFTDYMFNKVTIGDISNLNESTIRLFTYVGPVTNIFNITLTANSDRMYIIIPGNKTLKEIRNTTNDDTIDIDKYVTHNQTILLKDGSGINNYSTKHNVYIWKLARPFSSDVTYKITLQ